MDTKPLLQPASTGSNSKDAYGSVQTTEGNHVPSSAEITKRRWRSIRVLYITMFFNSVAFSIVAVSLYPYLQFVDKTATVTFLGWTNTGFSFGQAAGSLIFGAWCLYRPPMEPLVTSIVLFAGGSLMYSYAPAFPHYGADMILAGRIVLGIGTGIIAVCRTVASQMSTVEERATVMAHLALAQAVGFLVGPAMQACLEPIGENGLYFAPLRLTLNVYTSVGYLGIIISLMMLILLGCYFKEEAVDIYQDSNDSEGAAVCDASLLSIVRVDRTAASIVIVIFFIILLVFAVGETILSPLLMHEFAWTHGKVLLDGSLIMAGLGFISIFVFALCGALAKRFSERRVLIGSFVLLMIGYFMYLPWGSNYPDLQMTDVTNATSNGHGSEIPPGCPEKYLWCKTTPKLYFGQFVAAIIVASVGYAAAVVMTSTLFSKVLGPSKQGVAMGLLSASGSLARTLGPIIISAMYIDYGPRWMFTLILGCIAIGCGLVIISFRRLVPYHVYANKRLLTAVA